MESKDMLEESERLVLECRQLLSEMESLLDAEMSRSAITKYKRLAYRLREDNERLYRENKLLRSALGDNIDKK